MARYWKVRTALGLVLITGCSAGCDGKAPASPSPPAVGLTAPINLVATVTGPTQMLAVSVALSWSLPAPEQIAPPDRSVFDLFPRTTTFSWTAVPGAAGYGLEIDYCQNSNPWCENGDLTDVHWLEPRQAGTSFTLNFVGAQPGRWIVWALDADGRQGAKSPWRSFRFTQ